MKIKFIQNDKNKKKIKFLIFTRVINWLTQIWISNNFPIKLKRDTSFQKTNSTMMKNFLNYNKLKFKFKFYKSFKSKNNININIYENLIFSKLYKKIK